MTTYNTLNPLPSADARDRFDNSQIFDEFVNGGVPSTPDRFGVARKTMFGMETEFNGSLAGMQNQFSIALNALGYEAVHLVYTPGSPLTVNRATQLIDYLGNVYRVKTPATFPVTLSGTWATDAALLVDVGDSALRSSLANSANPSLGAALVARASQVVTSLTELRALIKTVPSKYVEVAANDWLSLYTRDDADTTTAEVIPFVIVSTDGARYKLNHNGQVTARQCQLVPAANSTALTPVNSSGTVNAVLNACVANNCQLVVNKRRFVCGAISLPANADIVGLSYLDSELTAQSGLNADFMTTGTGSNVDDVKIRNLKIHGNRANNTTGHTLTVKGATPWLENLVVTQSAENALRTMYDTSTALRPLGFEGLLRNIILDTVGKTGLVFDGPNDSRLENIIPLDCSLSADNTYYGAVLSQSARVMNLHPWNRSTTTNTPSSAVLVTAGGCNFSLSHFEGGHTPLKVQANGVTFDDTCTYYAPRGAYCIENYGTGNKFGGLMGIGAFSGNPVFKGILMSNALSGGACNVIDLVDLGCIGGAVEWAGSGGGNRVNISGFRATGTHMVGTPAVNDDVYINILGAGGGIFRQEAPVAWSSQVQSVAPQSGAFGSASATVRFSPDGKQRDFQCEVVIANVGTAAGAINVTMPFTATYNMPFFGYENQGGLSFRASMQAGSNILRIVSLTNTFIGAGGMTLTIGGRVPVN